MSEDSRYGIRLAIIYGIIWFIDLLDASLLNVALPEISKYFHIGPADAEWALIGFLLAMVIGMLLSAPSTKNFGNRPVFLFSQWMYLVSSLACGLSVHFSELVLFRILQGFAGGLAIPLGMYLIMTVMPHDLWAKTGACINFFSLLAPALGPILAGYITSYLNWRWLFLIKLPISLIALLLSHAWVKRDLEKKNERFDWFGFLFASLSLSFLLLVISQVGNSFFSDMQLILFLILAIFCGALFIWQEKRALHPIVPFKLFHYRLFAWGNLIQSAANMLFLGATFIVAIYLQRGLNFSITETGWIMSAITLGMMCVMPLTGKYYNRWGPVPFIVPGLLLMSFAMFGLLFVSSQTSPWLIALLIFCEGAGSAAVQSANFVSIFSEIPTKLKASGSSLYSLFKQISASFGIALSTMVLSFSMNHKGISSTASHVPQDAFYGSFILLGAIPLFSLLCVFRIDNQRALKKLASHDHLDTEFEHGVD